ncbi:MAG: diacylglycerol kinase family lipid kinase [Rikenellaceae bacterium]
MTKSWFAIVNPVAGNGKGLKDWPLISKLLRDNGIVPSYAFTERKYHAIELAVEAINKGFRKIIVVGGDGTIHEVVNGIFIQQQVPTSEVLLSVIAVGTGNDWIRMFGLPRKYSEAIKAIIAGYSFLQDVSRVTYYESGVQQARYMANVAGYGFDASVNRRYNHLKEKGVHSKWLYLWSMFKAVLKYNTTGMKITVDDKLEVNDLVFSGTVGIGRYNGGGMLQTPCAVADDGLLDLTVIKRISRIGVMLRLKSLFNGKIYKLKMVSLLRGKHVKIESAPEIAIEIDGEALGYSPFEFSVIERAVKVVVAERFLKEIESDQKKD